MGEFLFAAQDAGMMNGDYAFFSYNPPLPSTYNSAPWMAMNMTGQNVTYRTQAFYAIKQVTT